MAQHWDPERYAKHADFNVTYGMDVVDLLAPRAGERVLDLGCGDGALTARLRETGCDVVAVDASVEQVAAARLRGLDARVARAESLPFVSEFDAVFSNAALHWVRQAEAAVQSVQRALKPSGRFVGEFGGAGNIMAICAALREVLARRGMDADAINPWYYPSDVEYRALLERNGFVVRFISLFPRPTPLPTELAGWLATFGDPFLGGFDDPERSMVVQEICEAARPYLYDAAKGWVADYVRLRFAAERA